MSMRRVLVMALLGFALLLGSTEQVGAVEFLGEICWTGAVTEDETGPITGNTLLFRLGVTQMSGSYFSFQGTRIVYPPPAGAPAGNPVFVHGGAVVFGSEVILTGHSTWDGNPNYATRSGRSFQLKLSLSDLNGTFWSEMLDFDTTARTFTVHYGAGTATFSACP